jgi:NADPH:quinone reductase-like Zn-dependent oxidoreductase
MKAVIIDRFGPPDVLRVVTDHPKPTRKPGEVLVSIGATSVNPVDFKTRRGEVPRFLVSLPNVLGGDLAGTVVESDEGSVFAPGTRVYACTDGFQMWNREGCYAEFFSAKEAHLAVAPRNISVVEAAALPLVALTAWQALDAAALAPGQRVLIHAGAGGVGSVAIQLAKARGLHVTTTCSARNLDFVKELGADEALDYDAQRFEEVCQPFDGVVDVIGGDVETRSMRVLKRSGAFVSVLNSGWHNKYQGTGLATLVTLWCLGKAKAKRAVRLGPRYHLIFVAPNGGQLGEVAKLVEAGTVRPVIDRVLPLEEAAQAHAYLEKGHARGKVVLTVAPEAAAQK